MKNNYKYTLKENPDGSLQVLENNILKETIIPKYNLGLSKKLLHEFNNTLHNNKKIYERWQYKNFYIIPAIQEILFWEYFVILIRYEKFFKNYDLNQFKININDFNTGNIGFYKYYKLVYHNHSLIKKTLKFLLINLRSLFSFYKTILIYDDGYDGFRYKILKNNLQKIVKYSRIDLVINKNIIRQLLDFKSFSFGYINIFRLRTKTIENKNFNIFLKYDPNGFYKFLERVDIFSQDVIDSTKKFENLFKRKPPKIIFSYDQYNLILPILIACKINKIKFIAYQHGLLTHYHSGWLGFGIPKKFCNLKADQLLVWGEFWKKILETHSNIYHHSELKVATHLNKDMDVEDKNFKKECHFNKNDNFILYPYEFMPNINEVEEYLKILIKNNFKIIIKTRVKSKSDPASNFNLNVFSDYIIDNVTFVDELSPKLLNSVKVVIFTQSTYALEMMKEYKSLWYLDTSFEFLKDIVIDSLAHKIDKENINSVLSGKDHNYYQPKYNYATYKSLFNFKSQQKILKEIIS